MSEFAPGPSPEEMGIEVEGTAEDLSAARIIEVCREYQLPTEYIEELTAFGDDDIEGLIGTASLWIQEEGHDLDEFLQKIGA